MNKKQKKNLIRIIIAAVLLIVLALLSKTAPYQALIRLPYAGRWIELVLYLIPYLTVGYDILRKALKGIKNKQVFDENFLMAIATVGAMALSEYREGVAVMLFYQIGELFQSYAIGKSRKNITELMDIRPDYATIEVDGVPTKVDPDEVEVGTIILVSPGEKIPLDGVIVDGNASLDTSALTGESVPREAVVGDEVVSGCINLSGLLRIRTTREFEESTVSKILDMVENASSKKSRSENFITKFAKYYTPIVCYSALALAVIPSVIQVAFFNGGLAAVSQWVYRALVFLVISCPCALVISIPLTFFAGIGSASKRGVLVKGSNYLEALSQVDTVVFDKTGTLTKGNFEVARIYSVDNTQESENRLLELAAYAESFSPHPISKSLQAAYGKEIDKSKLSSVEEIAGRGIKANVNGVNVACGNAKLMSDEGFSVETPTEVGTVVYVAADGKYTGCIIIRDIIKEDSAKAMQDLYDVNVKKTVMLTGDAKSVADSVANELGIKEAISELLPQDKVSELERLLQLQNENKKLAFVGDGINDAPVLTRADVGIAMGAMGSDAAIEAADIVLMDDNPRSIAKAIRIAKKSIRIVYENIYFAIGVKVLCLILGALGIANMWVAIFADVGVMVIAVLNAIRALRISRA